PEGIHHPAWPIGKFVGPPPLRAVRRVRSSRQPLKIGDPVVGAVRRFFVSSVSGLCVVQRLHGGQPRTVAVTALIGQVAAELLPVALLSRYRRAANDVFRPLRRGLYPGNQSSSVFAPL